MADKSKGECFNVAHWLSRATFDVIGIAGWFLSLFFISFRPWFTVCSGFGYEFNAIQEENEEVYMAYKVM